jgi:hypothetical protein
MAAAEKKAVEMAEMAVAGIRMSVLLAIHTVSRPAFHLL